MKRLLTLLSVITIALAVTIVTIAANTPSGGEGEKYIDPVIAAADHYKLLSQEGKIRVIEMALKPGDKDNVHSHPHETVYFVKGGKLRIYVGDNKPMEVEIPDGHVMHHGPWTHQVENIGDHAMKAIIFERMH